MRWTTPARAMALLALLAAGCDQPTMPGPAPLPEPKTTQPAVAKLPDDLAPESGMDILVKRPQLRRTAGEGVYKTLASGPSGRLVGACKWAEPVVRRGGVPRPGLIDLDGQAYAIKDPKPGELKYYKNLGLRERWYFVNNYRGTYPTGVVLTVRGIKTGRRAMFDRPTFIVRQGRLYPHMQFAPLDERVMFGTYDSFPTHLKMQSLGSGAVVLDAPITAFDRGTIKPLGGGGRHYTARPKMLQSKVVTEIGPYEIRGMRHHWKRAYVVFVDNPYALVSNQARFSFDALPVGTWQIDVWHPQFQPVQPSYQIEIRKDETTELAVMIRPPESLKPKPKPKSKK